MQRRRIMSPRYWLKNIHIWWELISQGRNPSQWIVEHWQQTHVSINVGTRPQSKNRHEPIRCNECNRPEYMAQNCSSRNVPHWWSNSFPNSKSKDGSREKSEKRTAIYIIPWTWELHTEGLRATGLCLRAKDKVDRHYNWYRGLRTCPLQHGLHEQHTKRPSRGSGTGHQDNCKVNKHGQRVIGNRSLDKPPKKVDYILNISLQ